MFSVHGFIDDREYLAYFFPMKFLEEHEDPNFKIKQELFEPIYRDTKLQIMTGFYQSIFAKFMGYPRIIVFDHKDTSPLTALKDKVGDVPLMPFQSIENELKAWNYVKK